MAADPLGPPPSILSTEHFEPTVLSPTRLVRISAYHSGEPYFGTSGHNRFDAPGALAGTTNYGLTQQWSRAVHDNPARYDGFLYMSRHLNTGRAVALFERAGSAIHLDFYSPLASANGFGMAVRQLAIEFT